MDRYDYKKVLAKIEQKKMNKMIDFLYSLPYFGSWTRGSIQKFQYFFVTRQFKRNQTIFKEGQKTSHVYIILDGQFEISITHTFKSNKTLDCWNLLSQKFESSSKNFNKSVLINQNLFSSGGQNPFSNVKKKSKKIKLLILGRGNLFGEDDALAKRVERHYNVTCVSVSGKVLEIKSTDFTKKVKSTDVTLRVINAHLKNKEENIRRVLSRTVYYERPSVIAEFSSTNDSVMSQAEIECFSRDQRSMEEGFVIAMRREMRKQRLLEDKLRRTKMESKKHKEDQFEKLSLIQTIISSAKRELEMSMHDDRSYNSSSISRRLNSESSKESNSTPPQSGLPTLQTQNSISNIPNTSIISPTSQRPLSIYNLKININPLGNKLSGGQRVYLSQAYTIKPKGSINRPNSNLSHRRPHPDPLLQSLQETSVLKQSQHRALSLIKP